MGNAPEMEFFQIQKKMGEHWSKHNDSDLGEQRLTEQLDSQDGESWGSRKNQTNEKTTDMRI